MYSWKSLYPALVSALKLEKYAMFFILFLMALVAGMNMVSLLFMLITHKQRDIAILRAMGLSTKSLSFIFIFIGFFISLVAGSIGLLGAWLVGLFLQQYHFIKLPDIYQVTHLPVALEWHLFLIVFIVVLLIGFFASWIPAKTMHKIHITNILRFQQ